MFNKKSLNQIKDDYQRNQDNKDYLLIKCLLCEKVEVKAYHHPWRDEYHLIFKDPENIITEPQLEKYCRKIFNSSTYVYAKRGPLWVVSAPNKSWMRAGVENV